MKIKKFVLIFFSSTILLILLSPVRIYLGSKANALAGFVLFFLTTHFFIRKYKVLLPVWLILAAIVLGDWVIELPMRITSFSQTLLTLPDSVIHTLGIICGYFYWGLKRPLNILPAAAGGLITVFMFFQGYEYWYHKLNYGTFTGIIESSPGIPFEVFDAQQKPVSSTDLRNKIVVLDFWFTKCGACFEKFPQVQAVYDKYKSDLSVAVLAIDMPIAEDTPDQAFKMIEDEGYSFPVVVAKDEDLPEKFGVKYYPTTIVINSEGMIVYKGDIEGAAKTIDELKGKN